MELRLLIVGFDPAGEQASGSTDTEAQILEVRRLQCDLQHEGKALSWEVFDDPNESRTAFRAIVKDRKKRIDQHIPMADRPLFAVVTAVGNRAVRLEFYEGHNALELSYDVRAKELQGADLPRYLEADPCAYDPVAFLEGLGFPRRLTEPMLEAAHRDGGKVTGDDAS